MSSMPGRSLRAAAALLVAGGVSAVGIAQAEAATHKSTATSTNSGNGNIPVSGIGGNGGGFDPGQTSGADAAARTDSQNGSFNTSSAGGSGASHEVVVNGTPFAVRGTGGGTMMSLNVGAPPKAGAAPQ